MKTFVLLSIAYIIFVIPFFTQASDTISGTNYGDSLTVTHTQGSGDGNVYVVVDDSTQVTGHDYEVYFDKQRYYRNENGEWIPIPPGRIKGGNGDPDTLTGSTVDIGAVYGPAAGVIELGCYLNLVAPDGNWADGISMTFPSGITIIDAPPFQAGGGLVTPEIIGNTLNMGIVNGSQTGDGIFHGGEEWAVFISSFTPPLSVDWIIYDDGWSGGAVNAEGTTIIDSIGYLFKTEDHWNLRNLTRQDTVLEDQTVIMGYDLYTGEWVGDPIVEGFQISVDARYDGPYTYGLVNLNGESLFPDGEPGEPGTRWLNAYYTITDFTYFGYENGTAALTLPLYGGAGGTTVLNNLQQDYEFRWTGVLADTVINGDTLEITQSGGSIATLFGASNYNLANHPLNPNPGIVQDITVRIPFEVWNMDNYEQVNLVFWDRSGNPTVNGGKVWNTEDRMYTWTVNTPYSEDLIDVTSQVVADNATWNVVWYLSTFETGDLIETLYYAPITAEDRFEFTTPDPVVSVDDESMLTTYQVFQNYPNPFNSATSIKYSIPQRSNVTLKVYDILGSEIETLVNEEKDQGVYTINFDANELASGLYLYSIKAGSYINTKKMILLK
jgi:hypothetical protein